MKIFIQMGYVSTRRGAKLHLDIDGVAHCHSGKGRIIAQGELTEASAEKICRHCLAALRVRMTWRSDDLARPGSFSVNAEYKAINSLRDALEDLDPENIKAARAELIARIRGNLAKQREPKHGKPYTFTTTEVIDENQVSLF